MADLRRRLVAEALGTFGLVLIGPGAVMVDARTGGDLGTLGIAAAFALIVSAMIAVFGRISGAHLNPAVTLALWRLGRHRGVDLAPYVLAQCLGATLAAAALRSALGDVAALGTTVPALPSGPAFGVEFLLSALLMLVILAAAVDERASAAVAPLAIGLAVGVGALVGGPLTGASMNPARTFGPASISGTWTAHWLYWTAPILGMLLAVELYRWLVPAGVPTGDVPTSSSTGVA